jgi:O-antigen ligase
VPEKLLNILAYVGCVLLFGWLVWSEDLSWIPFVVGAIALLVLVSARWPIGGLGVMVLATAVSNFYVEFQGWKARPDHVVSFFLLLVLAIRMLLGGFRPFPASKFDYLLGGYVLMNYVSSILMSPARLLSLRWALLTSLVTLPYFLIRLLCTNYSRLRSVFSTVIVVGVLASGYGISCFLLNRLFGTTLGVQIDKYGPGIPGTFGTLHDSNNFGIYSASCSVMCLSLYLFGAETGRRRYGMAFLLTSLATVVSLARGVLLALVVAVVFLGWLAVKRRVLSGRKLLRLGLLACAGVTLAVLAAGSHVVTRLGIVDPSNLSDGSLVGRIVEDLAALRNIRQHPLLGNGTGSFHLLFDVGEYPDLFGSLAGQSYDYIDVENVTLRVLHDTGITGFLLMLALFLTLARRVRRIIAAPPKEGFPVVVGLAAAILLEAVAFQFSDDTLMAFGWVHLGLLVSALAFLGEPARARVSSVFKARLVSSSGAAGAVS